MKATFMTMKPLLLLCLLAGAGCAWAQEDVVPTAAPVTVTPKAEELATPEQIKAWLKRDAKGRYVTWQIDALSEVRKQFDLPELVAVFGRVTDNMSRKVKRWGTDNAGHYPPFKVVQDDSTKTDYGQEYILQATLQSDTKRFILGYDH